MSPPPIAPTDESWPRYRGWRIVSACFVVAMFCWGFGLYGHGVYLAELHRLHGWSTALISSATTLFYLLTAALVVFINDAIDRLGPRLVMLVGGCCFGVSVAVVSLITTPWQLYAVYALMAVGAASTRVGAISNTIGLCFDRQRGLALSLALNGASSGGIVVAPLLVLAIAEFGFFDAMTGAALLFAAILLPVVAMWIDRPPPRPATTTTAGTPASAQWTRGRALRSFAFWSIAAPYTMALTAQVGFLVHQIAFLQPIMGRREAGAGVAALTIGAIAGRLMLGARASRLNLRRFTAWSVASQAVALLVMTQTSNSVQLLAACAVFGLSAGNIVTLPALVIQREFPAAAFGMLVGLSWAVSQFTYSFGPGVLGALRDLTGGYGASFAFCIMLEIAAAILILQRPAPVQQAPIDFR